MWMLQRIREQLALILIALLPFHAFMVTVGTRLLVGAGQAPLPWLAVWKEVLLGLVLLIAVIEIGRSLKRRCPFFDVIDWYILGLVLLGLVIPSTNFFYGWKYTLFPVSLFFVLRRVGWSEKFKKSVMQTVLVVGGIVAGYGILTLLLPQSFLSWLGYSDLHSLYLPGGPLAAFQKIGGTGIRRIQSTMSGPNQLGMWLLIPLSISVCSWIHTFPSPVGRGLGRGGSGFPYLVFPLLLFTLFFTFSRAAWVGAAVIVLVGLLMRGEVMVSSSQEGPTRSNHTSPFDRLRVTYSGWLAPQWWLVSGCILCSLGIVVWFSPQTLLRPESSLEHLRGPLTAMRIIIENPLGLGLGAAGPASNRVSDSCVFLESGADASWANDRPDLCVFVGDQQFQPMGRQCHCPFLPENWYLQVGVELGIIGFFLFMILIVLILQKFIVNNPLSIIHLQIFLAFLGISVGALFLHSWEDSAVAYTVWILLSVVLSFDSSTTRVAWGRGILR